MSLLRRKETARYQKKEEEKKLRGSYAISMGEDYYIGSLRVSIAIINRYRCKLKLVIFVVLNF